MNNIKRPENFPKVPEGVKRNPEKFNEWLWSIAFAKDNQSIENKVYAAEKLAKIYSRYKKEIYSKKNQTAQEIAKEEAYALLKGVLALSPLGLTGCGNVGGGQSLPANSSYLNTKLNYVPEEVEWEGDSAKIPVDILIANTSGGKLMIDKIDIPRIGSFEENYELNAGEEAIFSYVCTIKETSDSSDFPIKAQVFHHVTGEDIRCNETEEKTVKILAVKPTIRKGNVSSYPYSPNSTIYQNHEIDLYAGAINNHRGSITIKKVIVNGDEDNVNVNLAPGEEVDGFYFHEHIYQSQSSGFSARVKIIYINPNGKECSVEDSRYYSF